VVLVLSGFAYPVSALLVNVLSSRGNSKRFLQLEIYKKIVFGLNLGIGFLWGIDGYLYGLIIASAIAVYLNIVFASHEISLPRIVFIKPIFIQAILSLFSVLIVVYLTQKIESGLIVQFFVKGGLFAFCYLMINIFIKPQSYQNFVEQFIPILNKFTKRQKVVTQN